MDGNLIGKVVPEDMLTYYRGMMAEMGEVCEERHESLSAEGDAFHVQAKMAAQLVPFLTRPWAPGEAEKKAKILIMLLHAQEHLQRQFIHLLKGQPITVNDAEGCANYAILALITAALNRNGPKLEVDLPADKKLAPGENLAQRHGAGGRLDPHVRGPAPVARRIPVSDNGSGGQSESENSGEGQSPEGE